MQLCKKKRRKEEKRIKKGKGKESRTLKSQPRPVACPPIQRQHLSSFQLLLAKVIGHAASDLGEGGAHYFAEVALVRCQMVVLLRRVGGR